MNMNHDSTGTGVPSGIAPCALEGNGTYRFGHYVPTSAEVTYCQDGRDPWALQYKYGYYTTYFCSATLAVFFFLYIFKRIRILTNNRLSAFCRSLTYPKLPHTGVWLPPLGSGLLILAFTVFITGYTYGVRPYTRPPNYGSYPIGLRTGWIATAMMPWIYVLAMKRNTISWATGVSYERLQVFHQWGGWLCCCLIHTVALIIRANHQQPWSYSWNNNVFYPSGFAALGPLIFLCIFSIPPIRQRFYESFVSLHIIAAILFVALMTVHVARYLGSQYYCYVTMALWAAAAIVRYGLVLWRTRLGVRMSYADVEVLDTDRKGAETIRLTIDAPGDMKWGPGQHVFLRFLTCRPLESHPFTIASIPRHRVELRDIEQDQAKTDDVKDQLVFIVRVGTGMTRSLLSFVSTSQTSPSLPVLIDGPYGGMDYEFRGCTEVVLIGGGTGVTFAMPILEHITRKMHHSTTPSKYVHFIWVARDQAEFAWFSSILTAITNDLGSSVTVSLYCTRGDVSGNRDSSEASSVKEDTKPSVAWPIQFARPALKEIISKCAREGTGKMGIAACGPESLTTDVRNATSACEFNIVSGKSGVSEIILRTEVFGW